MERKKTLTMNWDGLGDNDDEDDRFFESFERLSSVVPLDLASSGSDDDDEFHDPRSSFASAISSISTTEFRNYGATPIAPDYDVWMAAPGSINERRQRLLRGIGLSADKELLRIASKDLNQALSKKIVTSSQMCNSLVDNNHSSNGDNSKPEPSSSVSSSPSPIPVMLVRSRSDGEIESFSMDKKRKEDLLGVVSKKLLTRSSTFIIVSQAQIYPYEDSVTVSSKDAKNGHSTAHSNALTTILSNNRFGAFFLIKNLDTEKEFVVNEYDQDGMWTRVSDLQTGKKLTVEEFEKFLGHSPVVKELMRRESISRMNDGSNGNDKKTTTDSYLSKSLRISKRHGAALLKNIKGVAFSMSMRGLKGGENNKERENQPSQSKNSSGSEWIKVRQTGKSYKELSALHMCQEIQAHQGSIWTIKFSSDARFLASGGEDKTIHVWEVQECEVMSLNDGNLTPLHPSMSSPSPSQENVTPLPSERKKKKKGSSTRKGNLIPEYVHVSETVFSLSEKPVRSFTGHSGDVLDLSWSRSQLLLSSSMDKTVRLWDMETKSCLKMFAHNDFVTCIQFNPIDDNCFISGSLDEKVRIWSIPDRQLVDWTDLHEMVTAVCYTPDGQGAIIGSNKGNCHMYSAEDSKLTQEYSIDVQNKKQSRKKITGFQFSTVDPSEMLVTSAGSKIQILDGSDVVCKIRGFRNINSQISASFSSDGKYVISASEDSHVYVWKLEEHRGKKGKNIPTTRSHESFQCKDVSVAVPWNGTVKGDPPPMPIQSTGNSKRSTTSQPSSSCNSPTKEDAIANSKRHSSPLANDIICREDACERSRSSPARDESSVAANIKRQLPPLPKKNYHVDKASAPADDDPSQISQPDSIASSFTSNSSSARYDDPASISNTSTPSSSWSWSWFDGSNSGSNTAEATAWGQVIVTASLGGEIRSYQNFGLPRRIGRQGNLF